MAAFSFCLLTDSRTTPSTVTSLPHRLAALIGIPSEQAERAARRVVICRSRPG